MSDSYKRDPDTCYRQNFNGQVPLDLKIQIDY